MDTEGYAMELHSEQECYRSTIQLGTPEGFRATLIVLRRRSGHQWRVWLTFDGAIKTTVTMDDRESDEVTGMIKAAQCIHDASKKELA
jgi:hypothetical protein